MNNNSERIVQITWSSRFSDGDTFQNITKIKI